MFEAIISSFNVVNGFIGHLFISILLSFCQEGIVIPYLTTHGPKILTLTHDYSFINMHIDSQNHFTLDHYGPLALNKVTHTKKKSQCMRERKLNSKDHMVKH